MPVELVLADAVEAVELVEAAPVALDEDPLVLDEFPLPVLGVLVWVVDGGADGDDAVPPVAAPVLAPGTPLVEPESVAPVAGADPFEPSPFGVLAGSVVLGSVGALPPDVGGTVNASGPVCRRATFCELARLVAAVTWRLGGALVAGGSTSRTTADTALVLITTWLGAALALLGRAAGWTARTW